jgi:hypothetical protein
MLQTCAATVKELLKKQIPRGLKPARDNKNKGLTAPLKVRPFKTSAGTAGKPDRRLPVLFYLHL